MTIDMGGREGPPKPPTLRDAAKPRRSASAPDTVAFLALLQFSDGLFPAGGFAHSLGLETLVQWDLVRDRAGLEDVLAAQLEGSAGPLDAVAVALSVRHAVEGRVDGLIDVDGRLDAMKVVPEFRAASRQMGRQTMRVAAALPAPPSGIESLPARRTDAVRALHAAIEDGVTPGHHAVVFGAVAGRAAVDAELAAAAFLHSTCAGLVGAALRLLPIGQVDGQRVLATLRPLVAALAARAAATGVDDMWSFTPALEIAGIHHADLDARLFRS